MDARTIIAAAAHEWLPTAEPAADLRLDSFEPTTWEAEYTRASLDATGIMAGFSEYASDLD